MIGLIVLGLAFLFFLVVAFFAAKTWHVGHVVGMVFLFLFTLVFLYLTSSVMRTHDRFRPAYAKAKADFEREQQRSRTLQFGEASAPAAEGSLVGERTLARIEASRRGRVWGNVRRQPGQGIVLSMAGWTSNGCEKVGKEEDEPEPVPDDELTDEGDDVAADDAVADEAAGAPANAHGIIKDQFIHAFKEIPIAQLPPAEKDHYFGELGEGEDPLPAKDTKGYCRVPVAYVGKFVVQESTDQAVTVAPISPLSPAQQQSLGNNLPWVLYEKLPADSHELFSGVDAEKLPSLIPVQRLRNTGIRISDAAYQQMIREYAQDGKELAGRASSKRRVRKEVEFVAEYTEEVDVGQLAPSDEPFDVQGRAQIPSLLQGEPSKFAQGDTAVFDAETADRLIGEGKAKQIGKPTYSRQLRDFEYSLTSQADRVSSVLSETESVQQQVDALAKSLQRVQNQIDTLRNELDLLEQDRAGFESEKNELESYRNILLRRLEALKSDLDGTELQSVVSVRSSLVR